MSFVLVQWARRNPRGWERVPAGAFTATARKALPASGRVATDADLDDLPGWVNRLNIQGVQFVGDHYAVELRQGGVIEVAAWWDDPEDRPPEMRFARVWRFYRPRRDERLERGQDGLHPWNTLQYQTVFADSAAMAILNHPSDTSGGPVIYRPWEEFSPPTDAHHGIWLSDALHAEHEALIGAHPGRGQREIGERMRGWQDWIEA